MANFKVSKMIVGQMCIKKNSQLYIGYMFTDLRIKGLKYISYYS